MDELADALAELVESVEPGGVPLAETAPLWVAFERLARLANAGKLLLAGRVAESRAWRAGGHRGAAEYLAAVGGTSVGAARTMVETSRRLVHQPTTMAALRRGELSIEQATLIVDAAGADPTADERLIRSAGRWSLRELRDECRRAKAAADPDPEATHRRHHANRRVRSWVDAEGAWHLMARGTTDAGARLMAALDPIIDRVATEARALGCRESREAYAFDALMALAAGSRAAAGGRSKPSHLALVRVDHAALVRGSVGDGELCEITGLGPIPVSVARQILGDAVLELVITRGVDVANVTHLGRGPTAAQRIALLWTSPTCTVEGCNAIRVEHDHREPWIATRHTRLDELDELCKFHHDRKTYDGWGLVPGHGKRPLVPPSDPRHPRRAQRSPTRGP